MGIVKSFLDSDPNAGVIYFESESAITRQMIVDRGIDPKRMVMMFVTTVQQFRTQAIRVLDMYLDKDEADRQPMFLCLDSLGMLSTTKEVEDTAEGKETRDMTRGQVLKAAFRVLTLKKVQGGRKFRWWLRTIPTMWLGVCFQRRRWAAEVV